MYVENYGNLLIHRRMLADQMRCNAYKNAITRFVHDNSIVADVGSGTGIMAMFAAQAGAKKVYAIEPTETIDVAKKIAEFNGLSNKIEFIQARMEDVELPESVDLIISEWIGSYGDEENLLTGVLTFRDKWLKPNGHLLPEKLSTMVCLATDEITANNMAFWQSQPYGIKFDVIGHLMTNELFFIDHNIEPQALLTTPQIVWSHDAYSSTVDESKAAFTTKLRFVIEKPGKLSCVTAWFNADIGGETYLTNAPDAPKTHWRLVVFPLFCEKTVTPGTLIDVQFTSEPGGAGFRHTSCVVSSEGEVWGDTNTNRLLTSDKPAFNFVYSSL